MQCLVLLSTAKIQTIFRNGFILLGFCWCSRLDILLCAGLIVLSIRNANILTMVDLGTKYENYKWNVLRRKSHLSRWLAISYKNIRFRAVQGVTFRCNMWMLLIVKLLSFKRYNYPFCKCRENEQQM